MPTIFRIGQKVSIEMGDITLKVTPLTHDLKQEVDACEKYKFGVQEIDLHKKIFLTVKFMVKEVEGVKELDGSDYELEFEEHKNQQVLTNNCTLELLGLQLENQDLVYSHLSKGISPEILNPITKEPLEGVKIVMPESKVKKSSKGQSK